MIALFSSSFLSFIDFFLSIFLMFYLVFYGQEIFVILKISILSAGSTPSFFSLGTGESIFGSKAARHLCPALFIRISRAVPLLPICIHGMNGNKFALHCYGFTFFMFIFSILQCNQYLMKPCGFFFYTRTSC